MENLKGKLVTKHYDGHTWTFGKFPNGHYGFQQDDCPVRYTSKYEAALFLYLMS